MAGGGWRERVSGGVGVGFVERMEDLSALRLRQGRWAGGGSHVGIGGRGGEGRSMSMGDWPCGLMKSAEQR